MLEILNFYQRDFIRSSIEFWRERETYKVCYARDFTTLLRMCHVYALLVVTHRIYYNFFFIEHAFIKLLKISYISQVQKTIFGKKKKYYNSCAILK